MNRKADRLLFGSDDDDEDEDAHWEPAVNNSYVFPACLIVMYIFQISIFKLKIYFILF